jgi:DNA repair ATPase RecN
MNHNSQYNPVVSGGQLALQDYQMQLMLLEQQNKKRLLMPNKEREEQGTALRTFTPLLDQVNIAHTSVKELLENLPAYVQNIQDFKHSIPADIQALQGHEENLNKKEAEIKTLENRYNELIQMTPEVQQGELRQVKDRAMLTMRQDWEKLRLNRDNTMVEVEGRTERIAGFERELGRARELVPELIENLIKLAPKLCDV